MLEIKPDMQMVEDNPLLVLATVSRSVVFMEQSPGFLQANTEYIPSIALLRCPISPNRDCSRRRNTRFTHLSCVFNTSNTTQSNWAQRQKFDNTRTPQHLFFQPCILSTDAGCGPSPNSVGS